MIVIEWFVVLRMAFFVFLILMSFVFQKPETFLLGTLMAGVYAIEFGKFSRIRPDTIVGVILPFVLGIPAIISMNHGISPALYLCSSIAVFFAAKRFCEHTPEELLACFRIVFVVSIILIGIVLFVYFDHPEPFGEVIPGSSTNGIPSYLIVLQAVLSLSTFVAKGRLPLLSPAFTLLVAYFGLGRGSLIVSALILFFSISWNLLFSKFSKFERFIVIILFLVGSFFICANIEFLMDNIINKTKLREGLDDPYRMEIFYQYVDNIDAWSLISGADYAGTVIASQYNGNPHISFIRTHAYFGIAGLLVVVFSPVLIIASYKSWRYKMLWIVFIGLIFMRALSEPILFPTLLDFFYFCLFFIFFKHAPARSFVEKRVSTC